MTSLSKKQEQAVWLWYPGDMEIYHCMKQNFSREERGFDWPAYWHMDGWNKSVLFTKTVELSEITSFIPYANGVGYMEVNGQKHPFGQEITCGPGKVEFSSLVGNMTGLPALYVEGDVIRSDTTWRVTNYPTSPEIAHQTSPVLPGWSPLYSKRELSPDDIPYQEKECQPVSEKSAVSAQGNPGVLYDFGRLVNGTVKLVSENPVTVCYGESDLEALDERWCYYKEEHATTATRPRRRAFRYLFVPGVKPGEVPLTAVHTYVDIPVKAKFHCNDELLNRIFDVSVETFRQCSGLFFLDGVKRDRWVWSGDAYQSYVVNPYVFFDPEINKRTLLGLRGNLGIQQHLNTIVDYSLLWVLGVEHQYQMTGDMDFIRQIFPKVEDLMGLCLSQTQEQGFIVGRPQDWIFIDWADIDKTGPVAAEQVLFVKALETMEKLCRLTGREGSAYAQKAKALKENLNRYFWSEELGAYIDSYESGKNHVTRHANIFAVVFDVASEEQKASIAQNVLFNPEVPPITTPYFQFFQLDALCQLGYLDQVMERIKSYWGGMLDRGAVTFWEEFDPRQSGPEQYAMYGDPFGKSLCHAWGASPIYLLEKYFLGVRPTAPGYKTYEVKPVIRFFKELDCQVPVGGGIVHITLKDGRLETSYQEK